VVLRWADFCFIFLYHVGGLDCEEMFCSYFSTGLERKTF